jgi:hypothetical protein
MTTTKTTSRALVALNLPKPVPALITYAQRITTAMTGNPNFTTPSPTLAAVTAAISTLQTAQAGALSRLKGAVTTRNEARAALVVLLQQLRAYIQTTADANVENGASIIQSAAVDVRKTPVHVPRIFTAKAATVSGSVKVVAPSAGTRSSYEWEYSTNGGTSWVTAPVTLQAKTTIAGLTPGATVLFRYRPVIKTGEENWSQAVSLIVK